MISKAPINPRRMRRITGTFSWLDHRLLSQGFLSSMSKEEILLYFFLVLAGDRDGLSFYGRKKICQLLKISPDEFIQARELLVKRSLIAYRDGLFQVLQLADASLSDIGFERNNQPLAMRDIFKKIAEY